MHLTQPDTRCSVMGIWNTIPKAWLNSKNDLPAVLKALKRFFGPNRKEEF